MNAREKLEKSALGRKAQGSERDQKRGARVTGWGWRCTREPCALQGLAWCHRECVFLGWGELMQIQSWLFAVLRECSRSLQRFPGSEDPRNQHCLLTNHHNREKRVPSPVCPTGFLFACLFQHIPILLTIPVFPIHSQSQAVPPVPSLSFMSRLLSILLPALPSDPALQPCSGYIFLLHALLVLTGH